MYIPYVDTCRVENEARESTESNKPVVVPDNVPSYKSGFPSSASTFCLHIISFRELTKSCERNEHIDIVNYLHVNDNVFEFYLHCSTCTALTAVL
jgi:hypothetical protein